MLEFNGESSQLYCVIDCPEKTLNVVPRNPRTDPLNPIQVMHAGHPSLAKDHVVCNVAKAKSTGRIAIVDLHR